MRWLQLLLQSFPHCSQMQQLLLQTYLLLKQNPLQL
jgi:hypothetical protein